MCPSLFNIKGYGGDLERTKGQDECSDVGPRRSDPISQSQIHAGIDLPKCIDSAEEILIAIDWRHELEVRRQIQLSVLLTLNLSEQATLQQIASMGYHAPMVPTRKRSMKAVAIAVIGFIRARYVISVSCKWVPNVS